MIIRMIAGMFVRSNRDDRVLNRMTNAAGDRFGVAVPQRWEQHRDFLAAISCNHIGRTARRFDDPGHRSQHLVPGLVTELIVDLFEMINVDQCQCKRNALGLMQTRQHIDPPVQFAAVV